MDYEWDDAKARANRRKHGVDFLDAIAALEDPARLENIEPRSRGAEERAQVVGMAHRAVLFVVLTLRGETTCRIISARKATRHEEDRYYAGDRETW
ncbi:MAG: BrnT family toxin [Proteobacteria bacterium]|nr:BrnT family toxin [Pseudomonadota bacterium]